MDVVIHPCLNIIFRFVISISILICNIPIFGEILSVCLIRGQALFILPFASIFFGLKAPFQVPQCFILSHQPLQMCTNVKIKNWPTLLFMYIPCRRGFHERFCSGDRPGWKLKKNYFNDSYCNSLKTVTVFRYELTFDIYASTNELKISSKPKFSAKFVATITAFGEAKKFFKNPPLVFI